LPFIENITSPTPTLDSTTSIFDAIEYMIVNDCNHAFVQHEGEMEGVVSAEQLLEKYKAQDMSGSTIREYMGPFLTVMGNEPRTKALELMTEYNVDCIVVTNRNGVLLGVVCSKDLNS
jgi:CBS domain-containing protein